MVSLTKKGGRSRRTVNFSHLQDADRTTLLELWREVTGSPPPKNLSQPILRKAIAYELQCARLGGPKARVLGDLKVLSDKLEPVSGFRKFPALAGTDLPPVGKRSGAVLLEILPAIEMTFLVEMIVD